MKALHENCVCCRTKESEASGSGAVECVMTLLMMLATGTSHKQILEDLCFHHGAELKTICLHYL